VYVAGLDLAFRIIESAHPVTTGRDLILAAGGLPPEAFVILKFAANSELQRLRLDETVDLKAHTDVKFVVAKSDRTYRFFIEAAEQEWPAAHISGVTLKRLGQRMHDAVDVFLKRPGAVDELIEDEQLVDLSAAGAERFYFRPAERTVEIVVNRKQVKIARGEQTGLQIKEAAIAHGVPIQLDFVLTLHKTGGGTQVIGDADRVRVHNEQRFTAVADDDKS
jgi:hypothetical protein